MNQKIHGKTTWFFPDGDLPDAGTSGPKGHESLVILNPNGEEARVTMTVYFPDREADVLTVQTVGAQRVRCIRMDESIDGYQVPFGQYALKLESDTPIIAQMGRMDVQQPNLAYYTTMGWAS